MSEEPLIQQVATFFQELEPPVRPSDPLVLGLSGGPDSLALLHILTQTDLHPAAKVIAAHLDHGWRPESAAEAAWVAQTARAWGAQPVVARVDTVALAQDEGLSQEEGGRLARYRFLAEVAREHGATNIVTGHHADDQAETVLMHFLRGSGLAGLRGMLPASSVPGAPDGELRLIRPLLGESAAAIRAYCRQHQLAPLEDPTNRDPSFLRNRLRHELLPLLTEYNPQIRERLVQMAAVLTADYDLLEQLTRESWQALVREAGEGWVRLDRTGWRRLPLSLRRGTLRLGGQQLAPEVRDISFRTIELARKVAESGDVGAEAHLPGGLMLRVDYDSLILSQLDVAPPLFGPQLPDDKTRRLPLPGTIHLADGWRLVACRHEAMAPEQVEAESTAWRAFIDPGTTTVLDVRSRRPGERMQPLGMDGRSASIKEIMINRKMPATLRARWPLVAAGDEIVWLVGQIVDERWRVAPDSEQIFELKMEHNA